MLLYAQDMLLRSSPARLARLAAAAPLRGLLLRDVSRLRAPSGLLAAPRLQHRPLSTDVNPLLGVPFEKVEAAEGSEPPAPPEPTVSDGPRMALCHYRNLPVSPKKLVVVANLVPGLCVPEAMLQLEFCRKNIAVMVKNAIQTAATNAKVLHGLKPENLIVDQVVTNKATYIKGVALKSKGRVGIKKKYFSHLRVTVREASDAEVERSRYSGRWRHASKLMNLPWEERIKELPRYKPIPGYSPV